MPKTPRGKDTSGLKKERAVALQREREQVPRIDYRKLEDQVTKIYNRWGRNSRFDPGWTTEEWRDEFLDKLTQHVWDALTRHDQDNVLEFLGDDHVSMDLYSFCFPSAFLLHERYRYGMDKRRRIRVEPESDVRPDHGAQWLRLQAKPIAAWFHTIKAKLESQPHDGHQLSRLFKRQVHHLQQSKLPGQYEAARHNLIVGLQAKWNAFVSGDDSKRSWLAALQTLIATSRIVASPQERFPFRVTMMYYPPVQYLLELTHFKMVRIPKNTTTRRAYEAQSRSSAPTKITSYLVEATGPRPPQSDASLSASGLVPPNRLETADEVRVGIGRICLAYTLTSRPYPVGRDIKEEDVEYSEFDPGFEAFERLKWMIPHMHKQWSELSWLRTCITNTLSDLHVQAIENRLPPPSELPLNEEELHDYYFKSNFPEYS